MLEIFLADANMPGRFLSMNYYEILQVSPNASLAVIRAAFRVLIAQAHPDNGGDLAKIRQLLEAYEFLMRSHPTKRIPGSGSLPTRLWVRLKDAASGDEIYAILHDISADEARISCSNMRAGSYTIEACSTGALIGQGEIRYVGWHDYVIRWHMVNWSNLPELIAAQAVTQLQT